MLVLPRGWQLPYAILAWRDTCFRTVHYAYDLMSNSNAGTTLTVCKLHGHGMCIPLNSRVLPYIYWYKLLYRQPYRAGPLNTNRTSYCTVCVLYHRFCLSIYFDLRRYIRHVSGSVSDDPSSSWAFLDLSRTLVGVAGHEHMHEPKPR